MTRWTPEGCRAIWALTVSRPPDSNGAWYHKFGYVILKTLRHRAVICAACGGVLPKGTEVLYGDEYADHELWAPRRRHLHREPCL
jgi:hypothetical protein